MPRTPEQLVQNARDSRRFAGSPGTAMLGDYLDAIFQTLDERLPEKPMKVIVPATAPVEDTDETLARAIPPMDGTGAILYVEPVNGGVQFTIHNNPAKISAADAEELAYAILRTV